MNIKKILVSSGAAAAMFGAMMTPVFAAPQTLNWGTQINSGQCTKVGAPIVNVMQKVVNDVDSGQGGNNWAFDTLNRQIQVWSTGNIDEYCATVSYQGKFVGQSGQLTPGNTSTFTENVNGTFEGGYRSTIFTGTLLPSPLWRTKGSVGTTDYQCNITGICPGYVDWTSQYFSSTTGFDLAWWGWIYHGGNNGTWVNSVDGNSGDVI